MVLNALPTPPTGVAGPEFANDFNAVTIGLMGAVANRRLIYWHVC